MRSSSRRSMARRSDTTAPASALAQPQHARVNAALGPARLEVEARVSPAALLAIGGLVGMVLLGSAAIVWTARRSVARGGAGA